MKKAFLILVFGITSLIGANEVKAQPLYEGNINIDVYHGFPNITTYIVRNIFEQGLNLNFQLKSIGPLGGRAEYMVTDKVGLGLDIAYNAQRVTFIRPTDQGDGSFYRYNVDISKLGFMPFVTYHFIEDDVLDFYGMMGAGYGQLKINFSSNDLDYKIPTMSLGPPIAARIGVGLRYYFIDNFAGNLSFGFGQGGLINAGLTLKF